ncbi:MAG: HAMP domain-containing histidine kinase [Anaerolineaceae bacterium]|nr:HAMP domain-containing histidine kinase [Anaerolineaceae bacterium]
MDEINLLDAIKQLWLNRGLQVLTKGAGLREDLYEQLITFYELLEQAVETGDSAWLDPVLETWANSLTQTDLESPPGSLVEFINELQALFLRVCRETLDETQALSVIEQIAPWFNYCHQKASQFEIQSRINYVMTQMSQTQKALEKLDRTKSDFIAIASHELKTPLTLIEGYASMLTEKHTPKNTDTFDTVLLNGIQNGIQRLRNIIDDMVDVSLIDNNLLQLNIQPVWLNRSFKILVLELESALAARKLELEITAFPGSEMMIFADPERLLQAFRNILTNAIKYTPDGGKIRIDGRILSGFIETTVSDTGIGIALSDQLEIFDKFGRRGNSTLHSSSKINFKGGGAGLGLPIAKGIIEAHSGAIWAESSGYDETVCPGSVFHILLPIHLEPADKKMAQLFAPLTRKTAK